MNIAIAGAAISPVSWIRAKTCIVSMNGNGASDASVGTLAACRQLRAQVQARSRPRPSGLSLPNRSAPATG